MKKSPTPIEMAVTSGDAPERSKAHIEALQVLLFASVFLNCAAAGVIAACVYWLHP